MKIEAVEAQDGLIDRHWELEDWSSGPGRRMTVVSVVSLLSAYLSPAGHHTASGSIGALGGPRIH